MKTLIGLLLIFSLSTCKKPVGSHVKVEKTDRTYLALGDSYTVGDAVYQEESFPYLTVSQLNTDGYKTQLPHVIAATGWTSGTLLTVIKNTELDDQYDFVTILIGVNNQYSKLSTAAYRADFQEILDIGIARSKWGRRGVFVISIPDWSATPYGQSKSNPKVQSADVEVFNAINKEVALNASVNYIDVTEISRRALTDPAMTSIDDLHPSGKMYQEWVNKFYPILKKEIQ